MRKHIRLKIILALAELVFHSLMLKRINNLK